MIARNLIVHVELLSDVHIGTGTELVRDLDWIAAGDGWVYLANGEVLLPEMLRRAEADGKDLREVAAVLAGSSLSDLRDMGWLTREDFQSVGTKDSLFRYRLRGNPATVNIREQIKTVYGEPYLPGSTLKGALRTVLAVHAAAQVKPDLNRVKGGRSWAAQPLEQQLFGRDPNHDLLRALQVADSKAVSPEQLRLRRAHIYPSASRTYRGRSRGLDVDVETLAAGTSLEMAIHVTTELLGDRGTAMDRRRQEELRHWEQGARWLDGLSAAARQNAAALLEDEILFFQERRDVPAVHRFYNEMVDRFTRLKPNEMLLVLGWGGGWHTKTLNRVLKADPRAFDRLVSKYKLNPTGTHRPGDPFPKSRHLVRRGEEPGPPLGWVLVRLVEKP